MSPKIFWGYFPAFKAESNRDLRLEKIISVFLIAALGWKNYRNGLLLLIHLFVDLFDHIIFFAKKLEESLTTRTLSPSFT